MAALSSRASSPTHSASSGTSLVRSNAHDVSAAAAVAALTHVGAHANEAAGSAGSIPLDALTQQRSVDSPHVVLIVPLLPQATGTAGVAAQRPILQAPEELRRATVAAAVVPAPPSISAFLRLHSRVWPTEDTCGCLGAVCSLFVGGMAVLTFVAFLIITIVAAAGYETPGVLCTQYNYDTAEHPNMVQRHCLEERPQLFYGPLLGFSLGALALYLAAVFCLRADYRNRHPRLYQV